MEYNKIRELLERYWEGESSLEDEEMLRSFFASEHADLPLDLQEAQPLFQYFTEEANLELPALPAMETVIAQLPPVIKQQPWEHWMKYAAIFLIAVGLGYAGRQFQAKQQRIDVVMAQQDTYDDPQKAFAATQKALRLLAKNLNKGTSQVQKLSYFNEATEKIKAD
ncbi:hypothetical protein SAMN05518672_102303 [Chitinophaga sp. CF118]|uniref:hypothetical protein n=1 Tax=Chitinophaga sp. CF118 TaxID=1884367 RepID=UPI0008E7E71A|nr:hypothetical protein [Chitinophaga sp. CF118]SFD52692.1 hypothetical protein SAMN05518672_102303 [Chitinophaga sp. CF118]